MFFSKGFGFWRWLGSAFLFALLLWPAVHSLLTLNGFFSPWRLFGWGMYATPYPGSHSQVVLFEESPDYLRFECSSVSGTFSICTTEDRLKNLVAGFGELVHRRSFRGGLRFYFQFRKMSDVPSDLERAFSIYPGNRKNDLILGIFQASSLHSVEHLSSKLGFFKIDRESMEVSRQKDLSVKGVLMPHDIHKIYFENAYK